MIRQQRTDLLAFWGLLDPLLLVGTPLRSTAPHADRFRLVGVDVPLPAEADLAAGPFCSCAAVGARAAPADAVPPLVASSLPASEDKPPSCCRAGCLLGELWLDVRRLLKSGHWPGWKQLLGCATVPCPWPTGGQAGSGAAEKAKPLVAKSSRYCGCCFRVGGGSGGGRCCRETGDGYLNYKESQARSVNFRSDTQQELSLHI